MQYGLLCCLCFSHNMCICSLLKFLKRIYILCGLFNIIITSVLPPDKRLKTDPRGFRMTALDQSRFPEPTRVASTDIRNTDLGHLRPGGALISALFSTSVPEPGRMWKAHIRFTDPSQLWCGAAYRLTDTDHTSAPHLRHC